MTAMNTRLIYGWIVHVIPFNDAHEHEGSLGCWCHPVTDEDGIVIHNSADNREAFESGERKVS
jgi:hypothetical protein